MELIIDYVLEEKMFSFIDSDYEFVTCEYIFCDRDKENNLHDVENFENFFLKILHKEGVPENEILIVYSKEVGISDKRIGWMIPFSALISKEHDFKNDIHFGYYAFYSYIYLLNQPNVRDLLKRGLTFDKIISTEYVDKCDSVLFIVEKSNVPNLKNINCFDASLYTYGYYKDYFRLNSNSLKISSKKLILSKTSKVFFDNVYKDDYIEMFFSKFYFEKNIKLRYFMLYQLVEIVIDDIMVNQLQKQLSDFKIGKASTRGLDKLIKNNTELDRIKKMILLSKMDIPKSSYEELHNLCNDFLIGKGHDSVIFPESMYHFRNMIVHRFRWVVSDEVLIERVNDLMEMFLLEILIKYENEQVEKVIETL